MSDVISVSQEGKIAFLTMQGDARNSIDAPFLASFRQALVRVQESDARVLLIRSGREGFFSNGFDPDVFLGASREQMRGSFHALLLLGAELFFFPLPTISLIGGHAAGGGAFIATYADFRIMSQKKARIGFTEANLAMTVPSSALEILSRKIGYHNVLKTVLTGAMYKAEECLGYSLVDEIYEDEETATKKAESLAKRIAALPLISLRSLKKNASAWIPREHLDRLMLADLDEVEHMLVQPECQGAFAALKAGKRPRFD